MKHIIQYSYGSDIGKKRTLNQDNYSVNHQVMNKGKEHELVGCVKTEISETVLLGLFDGMGGEQSGEDASYIAAETASKWQIGTFVNRDIFRLFRKCNEEICRFQDEQKLQSIGTTAAVLVFTKHDIVAGNIGDSRIYVKENDGIRRISVDDSFPIQDKTKKPPLTQCLGIPPEEMLIEPHIKRLSYDGPKRFLICSDGLTDMVSEEEIFQMLHRIPIERISEDLIQRALQNGGDDNITVVVCDVLQ